MKKKLKRRIVPILAATRMVRKSSAIQPWWKAANSVRAHPPLWGVPKSAFLKATQQQQQEGPRGPRRRVPKRRPGPLPRPHRLPQILSIRPRSSTLTTSHTCTNDHSYHSAIAAFFCHWFGRSECLVSSLVQDVKNWPKWRGRRRSATVSKEGEGCADYEYGWESHGQEWRIWRSCVHK